MLLPQAARHQTISSVVGANSVKQIGQSPEMGLRFEGVEEGEEREEEGGVGAWEKISRSSCGMFRPARRVGVWR